MGKASLIVIGALLTFTANLAQTPENEGKENDYAIGIEDLLHVSVWGDKTLDKMVRVRPDGNITFPLVNDVEAAGRTADQIRHEITNRLSKFVREPHVTVSVEEINSFKVYVLGNVNNQGVFNLYRPTRLLQVIAHAGGFSNFAKKEVMILREMEGVERRIRVNYKRLVGGAGSQENIYLKPGDILLVD